MSFAIAFRGDHNGQSNRESGAMEQESTVRCIQYGVWIVDLAIDLFIHHNLILVIIYYFFLDSILQTIDNLHNSSEIAVRPFVEAFERELTRIEGVLRNHRKMIDASAEALLKDADGLVRCKQHGKLGMEKLTREAETLRRRAKYLQTKTLRFGSEATENQKELHRIALKADAKLRTSCVDDSEREFAKEPWNDTGSSGYVLSTFISDVIYGYSLGCHFLILFSSRIFTI